MSITTSRCIAGPRLTSDVASEVLRQIVDVDQDAGLVLRVHHRQSSYPHFTKNKETHAGVDTRDRHERARRAAAAVDDVDLRAADVELGAAVRARDVQRDLLHADEVLSTRQGLGEREGEARLGCGAR